MKFRLALMVFIFSAVIAIEVRAQQSTETKPNDKKFPTTLQPVNP